MNQPSVVQRAWVVKHKCTCCADLKVTLEGPSLICSPFSLMAQGVQYNTNVEAD